YCASYTTSPAAVTFDIDDTVDVVHGHQQLSLFNAHYDERCFLPIHVYDTATSRPVAVLLRPGKTPSGTEVRGHLRRLVRRIRKHWPATRITIRGDGHYGRPEVMEWCDENDIALSLVCPATPCSTGWSTRRPMTFAPAARSIRSRACAALPRQAIGRNPGRPIIVPVPGSRPPPRASISASLSPASRPGRPSISIRGSTALAARPRTSSNCTRPSLPPIAPAAA